jgi:hypothetical protein
MTVPVWLLLVGAYALFGAGWLMGALIALERDPRLAPR